MAIHRIAIWVGLLAVMGTAGCSTAYVMKVDSVVNPPSSAVAEGAPGATASSGSSASSLRRQSGEAESFTIKNRNSSDPEETLRYREAAGYLRTALAAKGLYEARVPADADLLIELDYGLDEPRTRMEEKLVPIYSKVGGGVVYEEQIVTLPNGSKVIRSIPVYRPPTTKLTGEDYMIVPVTTYEKFLKLTARDNQSSSSNPRQVWSVTVTSDDESNDIRKYIPILVSAALDYIGVPAGQETVKLRETSEQVVYVKNGG